MKGIACACARGTQRKRTTMHQHRGKHKNSLQRVCEIRHQDTRMTQLAGRMEQTSGRHHNPPSHGRSGVQAQASAACMQENLASHDASHPHSESDGKCVLTGFYGPFRQNTQLDFWLQSQRFDAAGYILHVFGGVTFYSEILSCACPFMVKSTLNM